MQKKMNVKHDNIAESEFEDVNMSGSGFTNINLSTSRFTNINLSGSRFHDINFSDVHFAAAQIGGCVFRHIGLPPGRSDKTERQRPVTFEEATLSDSVFRKVDLSNVRIVDCNIEGMSIDGVLVTALLAAYRNRNG